MKIKTTLLADALVAFAAPAFAEGDDATIYSDWDMFNSIYVIGDVFASGDINVSSESDALVDQDQTTDVNWSYGDGDNTASAAVDALSRARCTICANRASGVGNSQANDAALASVYGEAVFASAMLLISQTPFGNIGGELIPDDGIAYDASVSDYV